MSNQNDLYVLDKPEDYPQWTIYTLGLLQQKCCADALQPLVPITVNAVREDLVQSGFTARQLTVAMLVEIVHDRKNKQEVKLSDAAGIIIRQVAERHQHLIVKKEPHQMWEILKERFQDASPWSLTNALLQISRKKMSDYTSAHEYCSAYGKVLSETIGMLREDFHLDPKGIEVIVQGFMMSNTGEIYAPLIAQLRRDWKNGAVDFTETFKAIINYPVTSEKTKALHIRRQPQRFHQTRTQIPTCTTTDCIAQGRAFHTSEQCWIKHPELRPKFPLRGMKTKGTTQNPESKHWRLQGTDSH